MLVEDSAVETLKSHLEQQTVTTEHALISLLQDANELPFSEFNLSRSKDLFRAHFLMKHLLYKLQDAYAAHGRYTLDISLTRVSLLNTRDTAGNELGRVDQTKSYYLNLNHYFETEEDEVNELLNSFWSRYLASDDKVQALSVLELEENASYQQVKTSFKVLAQTHHPDKGGCSEKFKEIVGAKKLLDTYFKTKKH